MPPTTTVIEDAIARGVRLARPDYHVPFARSEGCGGCFDFENIRHPTRSGVPRRCAACPLAGKAER